MARLVTHPRRLDKLIFFLKELSVNPPTEGTGSAVAAGAQSVSLPPRFFAAKFQLLQEQNIRSHDVCEMMMMQC